jgi:hypothetical protein
MKYRSLIPIALMALMATSVLSAFQADSTATTVTKKTRKSKKAAQEATGQATPPTATEVAKPAAPATETAKKTRPAKTVSSAEIEAARASGKVWVNTESGVYHKGGQWYGATKQGKFMTEQEATQAGYHAAKTKEQ